MSTRFAFLYSGAARLRSWWKAVAHRSRLESEMQEELENHLAARTAHWMRTGLPEEEAARRARIELGPVLMHKEEMRSSLGLRWVDGLAADLRYAARMLRKSPGFTAVAALSLALAIGANTSIFSVAKQVLYERLAVPNSTELRLLSWTSPSDNMAVHHLWGDWDDSEQGKVSSHSFTYIAFEQLRSINKDRIALFGFKDTRMNATIRNEAQQVQTEMLTGDAYAVMGVRAQLGRTILPSDDGEPGQSPVAVISDGLWSRAFGRSPSALGQTIKLNDAILTIVGVNPPGFTGAANVQQSPDVFVAVAMQPLVYPHKAKGSSITDPTLWWINILGRMKPGQNDASLQTAMSTQFVSILRSTLPLRPGEQLPQVFLVDGSRGLFRQQRQFAKPMAVLMTLVGFVLLLACANVANLMLARGAQRQREMSVRLALGAGRARVLRQMLVESLLLAALGGAGGLVIGYWGRFIFPLLTQNSWDGTEFHVAFDWRVFAFTALVTLLTGVLFGLAPAVASARTKLVHGLKETAATASRRRRGLAGRSLVGLQIALSTLLVVGAGLFLRTLTGLASVDPGFRADHLLLAQVDPPEGHYPPGKDIQLHRQIEEAFASIPGVESVTPAEVAYVSNDVSNMEFLPEGERDDPKKNQGEEFNVVGKSFFQTLGVPIIAGRGFGPEDTPTTRKVAVINQALARKRFPGQNAVGKRFQLNVHSTDGHGTANGDQWIEIIGICGDTRYSDLREEPPAQFILPYFQQADASEMTYEIRSQLDPKILIPLIRHKVGAIDPDLPLTNIRTQEQQIAADMTQERVFVTLTSGFGFLGLMLAAVGIYGVMAYMVSQRTNEIGIRLALGAQPGRVRRMILSESTVLAVSGIVIGLGGALALSRAIKSMLYGIAPYDPLTLAASVGLLLLVALASSWVPAQRAAGVEPMQALRHE